MAGTSMAEGTAASTTALPVMEELPITPALRITT